MKKIILFITMIAISTTSTLFAKEVTELLSKAEKNELIRAIDDACGDSWCEGDYNFKFVNFSCDKSALSCDLSFHFIKSNEQSLETYSPVQICHFKNITSFSQLKDSKYSLNEKFYDDLTECIGNRQDEVQF